jgi:hypothetical protein
VSARLEVFFYNKRFTDLFGRLLIAACDGLAELFILVLLL